MQNSSRKWFTCLLVMAVTCSISIGADQLVKNGDRIVFLGDSNTYNGQFIADMDSWFMAHSDLKVDLINVGLSSETCCGLSEPDHPFPRPTVQERVDRVLEKLKPDVVIACYGMNDGIYHPFSKQRYRSYRDGIQELIGKVKKSGAKCILMTPPPFDPLPMKMKNKLADIDSDQFAWFKIYEDYDSVLETYSQYILELDDEVDLVVDIRTPILKFQSKMREKNPKFVMSNDGVHFDATCHRLIAIKLLESISSAKTPIQFDTELGALAKKKMTILRDAWLTETGHKRPGIKKGLPITKANDAVKELLASQK